MQGSREIVIVLIDENACQWHMDVILTLKNLYQTYVVKISLQKNNTRSFKASNYLLPKRETRVHQKADIKSDIEIKTESRRINFSPNTLDNLIEEKPLFILRLASGIVSGEILNWPTHGFISLHHGDNRMNRGGPAGFYESYTKQTLGITCQILNNSLDGGKILKRWNFEKSPSFYHNREILYSQTKYCLQNLFHNKFTYESPFFYNLPVYKEPKINELFRYFVNRIINKIKSYKKPKNWGIYINIGKDPFALRNYRRITPEDNILRADPFILSLSESNVTILYERQHPNKDGEIYKLVYDLRTNETLSDNLFLKKDYHLSFPYTLVDDENTILIFPEQSSSNNDGYTAYKYPTMEEVELSFPYVNLVDIIIYKYKGMRYAFATEKNEVLTNSVLRLFFEKGKGEFIEHPRSPIFVGSNGGRMASRIQEIDGKIFRLGQNGQAHYGAGISVFEIKHLSTTEYDEEISTTYWPKQGLLKSFHTFDNFKGISVIDGIEY